MKEVKENLRASTRHMASNLELESEKVFFEEIVPVSEGIFKEEGRLASMVFIGFGSQEKKSIKFIALPSGVFMRNSHTKDMLSKIIKETGQLMKPTCICMIAEAWMVIAKNTNGGRIDMETEILSKGPVANRPDREEICMFTFESENINSGKTDKIIRNGETCDLDIGEVDYNLVSGGRFSGFLKDLKKIHDN